MVRFLSRHLVQEGAESDGQCAEGMSGREQEETDEISGVPVSDAGANPRTVVVVHLYADAACATVEATWRPENLAGRTVAELVVFVANAECVDLLLLVEHWRLVLVLLKFVEPIYGGLIAVQLVKLSLVQVFGVILHLALGHFFDSLRDLRVLG